MIPKEFGFWQSFCICIIDWEFYVFIDCPWVRVCALIVIVQFAKYTPTALWNINIANSKANRVNTIPLVFHLWKILKRGGISPSWKIGFWKTHLIVNPVGGAQIWNSVLRQKLVSFQTDPLGGAAGENFHFFAWGIFGLVNFSFFFFEKKIFVLAWFSFDFSQIFHWFPLISIEISIDFRHWCRLSH